MRRFEDLVATFDRTGAAAEHRLISAHRNPMHANNRVLVPHLAAHQFIGLRNANGLRHAGHSLEDHRIHGLLISGNADRGYLFSRHDVRAKSQVFDLHPHALDIRFGGESLHHDEHVLYDN